MIWHAPRAIKRMTIAVLMSALFAVSSAAQQKQEQSGEMSLGEYARKLREKQKGDGKDHSWVSGALKNPSALSPGPVLLPDIGKEGQSKGDQLRNMKQNLDDIERMTNILDRTDIFKLANAAGVPDFSSVLLRDGLYFIELSRDQWERDRLEPRRRARVQAARAYVEAGRALCQAYESGRQEGISEATIRVTSAAGDWHYSRVMYDLEIENVKKALAGRGR